MKITQRCSCGATFEIEGPEVPVGFRVTEWLDAHAWCRVRDVIIREPLPGCGFANVPLSHGVAINSGAEAGAGPKPDFWALATEHGDEVAAPEAGPRVVCYKCGAVNTPHKSHCAFVQQKPALAPLGEVRCHECGTCFLDNRECCPFCGAYAPSPAQPEGGK